jgi:hypothetical protein
VGCSEPGDQVEITETATRSETRPVPHVNASSDDRFYYARPRGQQSPPIPQAQSATAGETDTAVQPEMEMAATPPTNSGSFEFETPPGWQQIAPSQFRNPNFLVGPNGDIECYVSVLQGGGGGLLTNANRWRTQMGRAPYSEEEFARLPRATVLGEDAVIVDFAGDFTGMGGSGVKTGYRLVGALIQTGNEAVFIKMVGPDASVHEQKDNFALFAQSLHRPSDESAVPAAEAPADPPVPSEAGSGSFTWTAPDGWTEDAGASPMRLVTLRFGAGNAGECYVAVLPGAAGGRLDNFNRWLAQMGEAPLQETELELQPTVTLFDEEVPMLIANGTYTGMGGESRPGHTMYGAVGIVDGQSVFVKMIAPEALAQSEFQNFHRFCASLETK